MATKAPLDLHEGSIAKFFVRDRAGAVEKDDALQLVHDSVAGVRGSAEQIAAMFDATMADTSRTESARLIAVKQGVEKIAKAAGERLDRAADKIKAELAAIDRATGAPPPPMDAQSIQIDSDIRRHLASLNETDRG